MALPLISVIVPVYKVEDYLERCVESIRNQTYPNLEIILVDDGSPDNSGAMCDAYAREDSRIRVIHKKNGGLSSARNAGLDIMQGEYVAFIDSDDWVEATMYEKLYLLTQEHDAQIAACGMQENYPDGRVKYFNPEYPENAELQVYDTVEALRVCLQNTKITFSFCDKLFHKSIFANIRMTVGVVFEDMEMIPKCLELAQTVVYDPYPYYHYMMTSDSILRGNYSLRRMRSVDLALEKALYYREKYPQLYYDAMVSYVGVAFHVVVCAKGVAECQAKRRQVIKDLRSSVPTEAVQMLDKWNKLRFYALKIHPAAYETLELCLKVYSKIKRIMRGFGG